MATKSYIIVRDNLGRAGNGVRFVDYVSVDLETFTHVARFKVGEPDFCRSVFNAMQMTREAAEFVALRISKRYSGDFHVVSVNDARKLYKFTRRRDIDADDDTPRVRGR